jgi:hypothetical protein
LAEEWQRDGRGLWAMRACRFAFKHSSQHEFTSWKYNVQPPAAALLTEQSRQLEALMRIAKEATNGWACHAKGKAEHAEIARLHAAIAVLSQSQP